MDVMPVSDSNSKQRMASLAPGVLASATFMLPALCCAYHFMHPLHALLLPQALSHASQLTHLTLGSCPRVTDRGLLALCRSRLRHLALDRCPQLSSGALEQLQRRLVLLHVTQPRGRPAAAPLLEY